MPARLCVEAGADVDKAESGRAISGIAFSHLTAVQPGWHEVDVALANGFVGSSVRALHPRCVGLALRRRIDAFLGW